MDDDLNFMDAVLTGLNSMDADLNRPDDITNPFDFYMWQSVPVDSFSIKNTDSLENVLYKMSTDIGLQNSKEFFCLKTTDTYSTRDNYKYPSADQQKKLLQLIKRYEMLFDGTLADWKTKPVLFQLREGVSPYHGQAFLVPKIHKDTIIKEVERLCDLEVLERQPASERALPSFIVLQFLGGK